MVLPYRELRVFTKDFVRRLIIQGCVAKKQALIVLLFFAVVSLHH